MTNRILGIAVEALTAAYSNAFTLLFLVTIAFGGLSIIAAWFTPAIEDKYTNDVMRRLHKGYGDRSRTTGANEKVKDIEAEHKEVA